MRAANWMLVSCGLFVAACHERGAAAPVTKQGDCAMTYEKKGYAVDPKTKWTYFKDTVTEVTIVEGGKVVAFEKSSRRYFLPSGAAEHIVGAALASLAARSPVHVAIDESAADEAPVPGGGAGALPPIMWIDPNKQHPSCSR